MKGFYFCRDLPLLQVSVPERPVGPSHQEAQEVDLNKGEE